MQRTPYLLTVGLIALACAGFAGCGEDDSGSATARDHAEASEAATGVGGGAGSKSSRARTKAVKFATCMRENGIDDFPDPSPSGELTVDEVANHSTVDTSSPNWDDAIAACKELQPDGFTGAVRSAEQQQSALKFAQCVREHGIPDFPDPTIDAPLIDTNRIPSAEGRGALEIPGLTEALDTCSATYADQLGLKAR